MTTPPPAPTTARYRVEHHQGHRITVLGWLTTGHPHHSTLDPYVSQLVRDGAEGLVLLVDLGSEVPVARRTVQRPGPSSRRPSRQRGVSPQLSRRSS
jgi:hypothetical protein